MNRMKRVAARRRNAANKLTAVVAVIVAAVAAYFVRDLPQPDGNKPAANVAENRRETPEESLPAVESIDDVKGTPIELTSPLESIRWGRYVGKRVRLPGDYVVIDTYNLAARGQFTLAAKRLAIPTETIDPNDAPADGLSYQGDSNVANVIATQKRNNASVIIVDDDTAKMDRFPVALFPQLGRELKTVRCGSTVSDVTGMVRRRDGRFFLVSDQPIAVQPASRPDPPDLGDANVTVASFNVLNYFTTIDNGRNQARGADSPSELRRQTEKLVAAIVAMDADVIGLVELENNLQAEQQLVAALNKKLGDRVYAASGFPPGFADLPGGGDSIRVGIIYRLDRVQPDGPIRPISDNAFWNGRTPLFRTFSRTGGSDKFTVVVNHFKSKGGRDARGADVDQRDGQSAYNASRRSQAQAIAEAVDGKLQENHVLVIGDLNAYSQEDPIDRLRAEGLIDLTPEGTYSYVYFGQYGSLDHALATPDLADKVTSAAAWHINADEPRCLDYNEEYGNGTYYQPTPFRSSDHDPILIGLQLQ